VLRKKGVLLVSRDKRCEDAWIGRREKGRGGEGRV